MHKVLVVLIISNTLLFFQKVNGQEKAIIDSFDQLIKAEETDSGKSTRFLELGAALIDQNLKSTFSAGQKSLELAVKSKQTILEIESLNMLANVYQRENNPDSAMLLYDQARTLSEELGYTKGLAKVYNNIAIIYTYAAEYEKAIDLYLRALKAEETLNNQKGVAQAYNNIAVVHYQTRNFSKTIEYLEKATEILDVIGDDTTIKKTYINIGAIHSYLGEHDEALAFYTKAYDISVRLNDKREMAICLGNMADAFIDLEKFDEAENMLNQALEIKVNENNQQGIFYEYENFAQLYLAKGDSKKAFDYFDKAIDLGMKYNFKPELRDGYRNYSQALFKNGFEERAYSLLEMSYMYNDSMVNETNEKVMAELETKYETAKKEQTILQQENDLAQAELNLVKRNRLLIALSTTALAIVFLSLFIVQRNKRKAQAEKDTAIIKEREEGIKAIFDATENERKRIAGDLHDGIGQQLSGLKLAFSNVANSIKSKLPEEYVKIDKLTEVLDETCVEVRSISHEMMPKTLGENGLISAIDDMLEKSLRFAQIDFEFEHHAISGRFKENIELSLFRVCQELVNNVVKHSQATFLSVQLYKSKNTLILLVEDNGKGMDTNVKEKEGIGLKNMSSRINSINGGISFEPSPNAGMVATIRVPIL